MTSEDDDLLTERFEQHRLRLRALAFRILGSDADADDAVQETWIRYSRTDTGDVENLSGWLTTVVSRVCLNLLQARRSRPQPHTSPEPPDVPADPEESDPEYAAVLADSVGLALLVVLDTLTPAERVAFVLHDVFAVPFDQIAPIVDRTTPATRQLASRARARVQRQDGAGETDRYRHAALVDAFLGAARDGNFEELLALLDPDVVLRADAGARRYGAQPETRGALPVAEFSRYARGATPAIFDGRAAVVWVVGGDPRIVYSFTTAGGRITAIDLVGEPARMAAGHLVVGRR